MKPIKILFFLNSLTFGGAERQTIDLISNLSRKQFSVGLVYLDKVEELLPEVRLEDLFLCICLGRKGKLDFNVLKKLNTIVSHEEVDIIFCVNEYVLVYAYFYRLIYKKSALCIISSIHHTVLPLPTIWKRIKKKLHNTIINNSDKVIFVCHNQAQYWQAHNGTRESISTVVYNGIDASFFSPAHISPSEKNRLKKSLGFSGHDFIAGMCARLSPVKCHSDFLQSLAQAKDKGLHIKGLLIGDGPERKNIEKVAVTLGLTQDVVITGFVRDVRPYMAICDCLAITSRYSETFSISALEAMAMAKPLIMTGIGGADEQVQDGTTGFLYEPGQIDDLAQHMLWLGTNLDKSREMGDKARCYLLKNFTLDTMTKEYEKEFAQIVRKTS
jgi:glycosyltransferase involved in cell wall biosynthesis